MKRTCLLGLLAVLAALPARADDYLPRLMGELAAVKSSSGHFTQSKTMSVLTTPLVSTGTLSWRAPDHLERVTLTPKPESLVVDGDRLTVARDGGTHTVPLGLLPGVAALVDGIRATLCGDLATLQAHYTVTPQGDEAHWVLLLQPKESMVQRSIQYVRLSGEGRDLHDVETLQANGDSSDMIITPDKP